MSFNNYGTVRAKTYLGAFANVTDLVVTGNATISNLVYQREFVNISNTNVLNANIITVSDSLTLGAGSTLNVSNAVSISLGANATATSLSVETVTMNVGTANLFTVQALNAANVSMNVGTANLFTVQDLNAANLSVNVGTANILTVASNLSTANLSLNVGVANSLTIASSLTLGPGATFTIPGSFSPATVANSNLVNIGSIEVSQGKDARFQVAWTEAANAMFSNLMLNSNLVESDPTKFIVWDTYDYANTVPHIGGTRQLIDTFQGFLAPSPAAPFYMAQALGSNTNSSNILIHKHIANGKIVAPYEIVGLYESNVEKSHKFYAGYRMTAGDNWYEQMKVQKVDSSNITANTRFCSFSVSKGVFALVVAAMVDKNMILSMDDNISNYFSNVPTVSNGRLKILGKDAADTTQIKYATRDITVRHVLTECSGIPAFSPFGDSQSMPVRMTADNVTLDLSDFTIASNVYGFRQNDPFQFFTKDISYGGGQGQFQIPQLYIAPGGYAANTVAALTNTVSTYVQTWFDDNAYFTMYLDAEPGAYELYQSTTQIGTALIEKIYYKHTGVSKNYHEILTELVLEPLDLTENDFCQYQDPGQLANVHIDVVGPDTLGGFLGSNAATSIAALGGNATGLAGILSAPPVVGPLFQTMWVGGVCTLDGYLNAYLKNGSPSPTLRSTLFNLSAITANTAGYDINTSKYLAQAQIDKLIPDITGQMSNPQFFDYGASWSATMDTYARIFSLVSNNGYYKGRRIFGGATLNGLLTRDDGTRPVNPILIGAAPFGRTADVEGLYPLNRKIQNKNTKPLRAAFAININGEELPARMEVPYKAMSNLVVDGLSNLYTPGSFAHLDNFYRTDAWGANVYEMGTYTQLALSERLPGNEILLTAGAGGITIYMDRTSGYTMVAMNPGGTNVKPAAADLLERMFYEFVESGPSDFANPATLAKQTKILQSPLLYSSVVNRNTLYAKPAEPLLRVNRLEVYPVGGVGANVVSLTTDTLSNLVVSNVSSTVFTVGPN